MNSKSLRTRIAAVAMVTFAVVGMLQVSSGVAEAGCIRTCAMVYVDCRHNHPCDACEDQFAMCATNCGANPGVGICL